MAGQERFVNGFAVLLSRRELDAVAVYTASRDRGTGLPPREQEPRAICAIRLEASQEPSPAPSTQGIRAKVSEG